jgi:hypothetical protein
MRKAFLGGRDPRLVEKGGELVSRPMPAVSQRPFEHPVALAKRRGVEIELAMPPCRASHEARCDEGQHPANILGKNELPGPTHEVHAQDRSVADGPFHGCFGDVIRKTEPDGPLRAGVVLRLNGAKPTHHIARFCEGGARQLLRQEAPCEKRGDEPFASARCPVTAHRFNPARKITTSHGLRTSLAPALDGRKRGR